LDSSQPPPLFPVTKWQKFATERKGKKNKKKKPKKTIIPTIGFGKIEGLVSQPQNPKHLEKKIWNLFFLMSIQVRFARKKKRI
jgi:hypothetical protein